MEETLDALVPILGIICCIGLPISLGMYMAIRAVNTKHIERMELIKQGIVPAEQPKLAPNKYRSLRNGFLCIGIALGLIIGYLITANTNSSDDAGVLIIGSSVLFFLGLAYVLFFFITRNSKNLDGDIE